MPHHLARTGALQPGEVRGRADVKLANTVTDSDTRHLHWLADRMGDKLLDAIVVNTGPNAYRRPDGIGVNPRLEPG